MIIYIVIFNSSSLNGTAGPTFIPLVQEAPSNTKTESAKPGPPPPIEPAAAAASRFVFGQNLQARVVSQNTSDGEDKTEDGGAAAVVSTNGTSDMLFSSALKETGGSEAAGCSSTPRKTLSEAAREYEETHSANKRKYEEVGDRIRFIFEHVER